MVVIEHQGPKLFNKDFYKKNYIKNREYNRERRDYLDDQGIQLS